MTVYTNFKTPSNPGVLPAQTAGMENKICNTYRQNPVQAFLVEWITDKNLCTNSTQYNKDTGRSDEVAIPWTTELPLSVLYEALKINVDAHSGSKMPGRNAIAKALEPYNINLVCRGANIKYAVLPHPSIVLDAIKNMSRSDAIVTKEQEKTIREYVHAPKVHKHTKAMPEYLACVQ